jgi:hypothetical protein
MGYDLRTPGSTGGGVDNLRRSITDPHETSIYERFGHVLLKGQARGVHHPRGPRRTLRGCPPEPAPRFTRDGVSVGWLASSTT